MGALTMNQVPAALGWQTAPHQAAAIVGSILGPVVTGGADVFRTYQEGRQGADELKQREREFAAISKLQAQQIAAKQRADTIAEIASIQRARITGAAQISYMPYVIGGVALIALSAVALGVLRKGGK